MKNFEQAFRSKRLLAEMGENISSLARKLKRPFGSVANNIYGYRANAKLRGEIASFLGHPVKELFEEMGLAPRR
uniref:XRE family transcriptional regulator n=1 Tax=Desulfobacca acetoxidans TaxID=60893 RepID=A0A7V4G920_9BACT